MTGTTLATNQAVLDALGLGGEKRVVSATIHLNGRGTLPIVRIKRHLPDLSDAPKFVFETHVITAARRIDHPAFDVDAACDSALRRIRAHIDQLCTKASNETAADMLRLRLQLGIPVRKQHIEACGEIFGNQEWIEVCLTSDSKPRYIPRGVLASKGGAE